VGRAESSFTRGCKCIIKVVTSRQNWMDVSEASYCIKKIIKAAKWGTPKKNIKKKNILKN
jgi:hypothetical protein